MQSNIKKKSQLPAALLDSWSDAIKAIQDNNYHRLSYILDQNDFIGLVDADSLGGLLMKACKNNSHISIARALVNYGSNVNYFNKEHSNSCLMIAAKNNNRQLLRLLIEVGARVNAIDNYGWTALFYASYFDSVDCTEALLEYGAQVNLTDCDGINCLIWASGRGHISIVKLLIKYGANVNVSDRYNTSPLIWASRKGDTEIVKTLLENGSSINERGMYGWTSLIMAVRGNHLETTRMLLSYKPDLNICDSEKMSPLLIASKEGFREIALELIKHGASVNQPDENGNTPLIYATMTQCSDIVKSLIKAGAYLEHLGQFERNAIHWSVIKNDAKLCKLFLEQGIDINLTTSNGGTYLMLAAKYRNWEVIKLLQEYHA